MYVDIAARKADMLGSVCLQSMQVLAQQVPCHKHVRARFCLFISSHQDDEVF